MNNENKFPVIPGVPGVIYYFTIAGRNRTIVCTESNDKYCCFADLKTTHTYKWDLKHFSYLLRTARWKDPTIRNGEYETPTITVQHEKVDFDMDEYKNRVYGEVRQEYNNILTEKNEEIERLRSRNEELEKENDEINGEDLDSLNLLNKFIFAVRKTLKITLDDGTLENFVREYVSAGNIMSEANAVLVKFGGDSIL